MYQRTTCFPPDNPLAEDLDCIELLLLNQFTIISSDLIAFGPDGAAV